MIASAPLRLNLIGGFLLRKGDGEITVAASGQRLVALLALHHRQLSRQRAAAALWPKFSAKRSLADLRTSLWRINQTGEAIVTTSQSAISLHAGVDVDVLKLVALTRQLEQAAAGLVQIDLDVVTLPELTGDLLPDWDEEWVQEERECVRQVRLHALEALAAALSRAGRHADAIQTALAAIRIEPLRETAHRTLIEAHLAEGNRSEARRQFGECRRLLRKELGVEPSESVRRLIRPEPAPAASRVLVGRPSPVGAISVHRDLCERGDEAEPVRSARLATYLASVSPPPSRCGRDTCSPISIFPSCPC
jgi:DNA-binding SARP family transcriptional activator